MRLFFALWPPPETAQALARWARTLPGSPVAAEKIHLTLAFLGDAEPAAALAAGRAARAQAFDLPIETAGYWRHNEILWVGPRETPQSLKLLAESLCLKKPRRPFTAHVTLLRKAAPPGALPPVPEVRWPAREFALMSSSYAKHETLARFPLH